MYRCTDCDTAMPRSSVKHMIEDAYEGVEIPLKGKNESEEQILSEIQHGLRTDVKCPECDYGLLYDDKANADVQDADLSPDDSTRPTLGDRM